MSGHEGAREEMRADLASLAAEITVVRTQLVLPGWGGPLHGFHRTLYGYVMNCFAFIDLLSSYWSRTHQITGGPTQRMIGFTRDHLGYGELASSVAVHMWRHKLMHTAKPRALLGSRSAAQYRWLLHWGAEHLPRDQHMQFQQTPDDWTLNLGLEYLVEDLRNGADGYIHEVEGSPDRQTYLAAAYHELLQPQAFND